MIGNLLASLKGRKLTADSFLTFFMSKIILRYYYINTDYTIEYLTKVLNKYPLTSGASKENLNEFYLSSKLPAIMLEAGVRMGSLNEVENAVNKIYSIIFNCSKEDAKKVFKYRDSVVLAQVISLLINNHTKEEVKEFLADKLEYLVPNTVRAINYAFESNSYDDCFKRVEFKSYYEKAIALSIAEYLFGYIDSKYIRMICEAIKDSNTYELHYELYGSLQRYLEDRITFFGEVERVTNDTKVLIANYDVNGKKGKEVYCAPHLQVLGKYITSKIFHNVFCYEYNDMLEDALALRSYDDFFGILEYDCFYNDPKMLENCEKLYHLVEPLDKADTIEEFKKHLEVFNDVLKDVNDGHPYLPNCYTSLEIYDNPLEVMEKYSLTEFSTEIFNGIKNIERENN